ncbi:Sjogren's syndrome/scleroderma autoantigen 1 family protein [Haloarculaceae archaeon H-GB11]|nr:Sjogren's syndrome/scleroderma autoantigen 1 family protein [Haloarculaceae archaeon H-GB11]
MSDFDKEAERERLREKYERDKAKREATEQMSDLLLKGATMTNAHCGECGDPIFRHEGQEFCPTCQTVLDDGSAPESEAESDAQQDLPDDGPSPAPDTAGGDETKGISSDTSVETPTPDATATSDESGRTTDSAGEAAGDRESPSRPSRGPTNPRRRDPRRRRLQPIHTIPSFQVEIPRAARLNRPRRSRRLVASPRRARRSRAR